MSQIIIITFFFVYLVTILVLRRLGKNQFILEERLKKFTLSQAQKRRQEEDELSKPFTERVLRPLMSKSSGLISRFMPTKSREKLQHTLQAAGNPGNLKAHEYQTLHYALILILALGGWVLASLARKGPLDQVLYAFFPGLLGYLFGKSFLSSLIRKRQVAIQRELPDVLDLLTVSVEAGLGFDAALLRVVEKSKGVLTGELKKTLQELQMGKARREALRDLGNRAAVDDLQTFVGSMIQADQLGISISKVLRSQAEQVRIKRRQRVEEKAMKAPVKMLFPLIFFIFPSIFIVLLGPAVIQIYSTFVK